MLMALFVKVPTM